MLNDIAFRPEYVYVEYEDVIRSYIPTIYKYMMEDDNRKYLEQFIPYKNIENLSTAQLNWLSIVRSEFNLFRHLMLNRNNNQSDLLLAETFMKVGHIYKDSEPMITVNTINRLLEQSFIKGVFINVPVGSEEEWCRYDICNLFANKLDKISFVSSISNDLIKEINQPTLYIVSNISTVMDIFDNIEAEDSTDILLANYGYNYEIKDKDTMVATLKAPLDIDKQMNAKRYNLTLFSPIDKDNVMRIKK